MIKLLKQSNTKRFFLVRSFSNELSGETSLRKTKLPLYKMPMKRFHIALFTALGLFAGYLFYEDTSTCKIICETLEEKLESGDESSILEVLSPVLRDDQMLFALNNDKIIKKCFELLEHKSLHVREIAWEILSKRNREGYLKISEFSEQLSRTFLKEYSSLLGHTLGAKEFKLADKLISSFSSIVKYKKVDPSLLEFLVENSSSGLGAIYSPLLLDTLSLNEENAFILSKNLSSLKEIGTDARKLLLELTDSGSPLQELREEIIVSFKLNKQRERNKKLLKALGTDYKNDLIECAVLRAEIAGKKTVDSESLQNDDNMYNLLNYQPKKEGGYATLVFSSCMISLLWSTLRASIRLFPGRPFYGALPPIFASVLRATLGTAALSSVYQFTVREKQYIPENLPAYRFAKATDLFLIWSSLILSFRVAPYSILPTLLSIGLDDGRTVSPSLNPLYFDV